MLTNLSLDTLLDQEFEGRHQAERVQIVEVSCVRYLIGWIMKTYDYINRVVITLPLTVYEGTWITLFPSCCYASPRWILRVRRNFLEITAFPNSGIRARSMRRCYMHE